VAVKNEEKTSEKKAVYMFKKCLPCRIKLNINVYRCPKCARRADDMIYGSSNPDDATYGMSINQDKCCLCSNTLQGNPCLYVICFGTGRGACETCKRFNSTRFECCQRAQFGEKKGGVINV